ncbi:hypothetical protein [Vreelandella sedimenti]|uniref:Y-family DNA polymerase n=1 Tax=Vreelandella sedimenti TaxID=2729618 RepID=UPI002E281276|nr:hypothetical protein [Halomonas sedimenti]
MIGLVDCNNFYVSCESVFNHKLNGRPVGIMSNNDGCIIARSEELKALGIEMGTPAHQVRHLVERGEIVLHSSNYELYGDMSQRVQGILEQETAGVEPYSIDEMFVRMDGFEPEALLEHAKSLHRKIRRGTGIPVCVSALPLPTPSPSWPTASLRSTPATPACASFTQGATKPGICCSKLR